MPFDLTPFAPIAGAVAAVGSAAALVALHKLTPHRQARPVPTLLFYRAAAGADAARVLGGPLSRRWTFLLLLATCGLIAAAVAVAPWAGDRSGPAAVVVDAGCELDGPTWDRLRADAGRVAGRPAVVLAADQPTVIAPARTPAAVAADRLSRVGPAAGPSRPAAALLLANDLVPGDGPLDWFTTAAAVPADVPPAVARRVVRRAVPPPPAAVLTAVAFTAAERLQVRATGGSTVTIGTGDDRRSAPLTAGTATFDGVPADGRTWTIDLPDAAGPAAVHAATIVLPRRDRPRFRFDPATPAPLREALAATFGDGPTTGPSVSVGSPDAILAVVPDGRTAAAARPLTLQGQPSGASVAAAAGLALPAGSVPLLSAGDDVFAAVVPGPSVRFSAALFDSTRCDLTRRAAFPLLIRSACERLRYLTPGSATVTAERLGQDPLWPAVAGGSPAAAVVFDPPTAAAVAASVPAAMSKSVRPSEWLLAAAVLALTAEGLLFARRKVV